MPTEGLRQRAPRSPRTKAEMEAWSKETLAETLEQNAAPSPAERGHLYLDDSAVSPGESPAPGARTDGAPPRKSLALAYLLWAAFPCAGFYHLYLGRDHHCAIHGLTCGLGMLGWLRDGWMLPYYARLANEDAATEALARATIAVYGRPPVGAARLLLMLVGGALFGFIVSLLIPPFDEFTGYLGEYLGNDVVLLVAAHALGEGILGVIGTTMACVYIGSIPPLAGARWRTLLAAAVASALSSGSHLAAALGAVIAFKRTVRRTTALERRAARRRPLYRVVRVGVVIGLAWAATCTAVVQHGTLTDADGHVYRVKDVWRRVIASPFWGEAWVFAANEVRQMPSRGWSGTWARFADALDVDGARAARATLGVESDASIAEIKKAYRRQALQYHPDKIGDRMDATDEERRVAEEKFRETQAAYETLAAIARRRESEEGADRPRRD